MKSNARPARAQPPKALVALIGRPNVGKSTLFNRLVGKQLAIVHDQPGVTRDRHYADATVRGRPYILVDTGGFDPDSDDEMHAGIASQIEVALAEADVIVCVLDATCAPSGSDSAAMGLLRRAAKPVLYFANKCDGPRQEAEALDLYRLGMEDLICASALHGRGIGQLEQALFEALGPAGADEDDNDDEPWVEEHTDDDDPAVLGTDEPLRIAVVGRPNAGKSSLINRLAGQQRLLVDERPGTTRDPIDTIVERQGRQFVFVDTAGIRRKGRVAKAGSAVEAMSVLRAVRAIDRAQIVVLLTDAEQGVAEQDAKIVGLAVDRGRGLVIGLNKIDLLSRAELREASQKVRDVLAFVPWAPLERLSALTGRGVDRLLKTIARTERSFTQRVSTGELNRFFDEVIAAHPPPISGGRAPRFYYLTQARIAPPLFVVVASHAERLHFSYQRYVVNAIRDRFGFDGVPIRVRYRRKDRRERKRR